MTIIRFPAAPVPDLAPDEERRGAQLTKDLLSLQDPGVRARIEASSTSEFLREPYGVYWLDGRPQAGVIASTMNFTAGLRGLPDVRIDHWLRLARFAVQVEMKHWNDDLHVLNTDRPCEVLVDLEDYLDSDDERLEASKDNRDRWAELADIATHHALAEQTLAFSHAA